MDISGYAPPFFNEHESYSLLKEITPMAYFLQDEGHDDSTRCVGSTEKGGD